MKRMLVLLLLMTFVLVACDGNGENVNGENNNTNNNQTSEKASDERAARTQLNQDKMVVYVKEDGDLGELYYILDNQERKKIASDVLEHWFVYAARWNSMFYFDSENTMYYAPDGGQVIEVAKNVEPSSLIISDMQDAIAYMIENDLYISRIEKGEIQERMRVDTTDSYYYGFSDPGHSIGYLKNIDDLYVKTGAEPSRKMASGVTEYEFINEELLWYSNNDRELYLRKISEDENRKISTKDVMQVQASSDGRHVLFLADYNYSGGRGELYVLEGDVQPRWLASDVTLFYYSEGKVYYLNVDSQLFYRDLKEDRNQQIATDVYIFDVDKQGRIFYVTENGDLHVHHVSDDSSTRIAGTVDGITLYRDGLLYMNEEQELYSYLSDQAEKIAESVINVTISPDLSTLAYYDENDQVFIVSKKGESKTVIENADQYSHVYHLNELIYPKDEFFSQEDELNYQEDELNYQEVLGISDVVGYWLSEDETIWFKLEEDGTLILQSIYGDEVDFRIEFSGYNAEYAYLTLADDHDEEPLQLVFFNDSKIAIDEDIFNRISADQYEQIKEVMADEAAGMANEEDLSQPSGNLDEIGFNLWYTDLFVPEGTDLYVEYSERSHYLGSIITGEVYFITGYYVDHGEDSLWLKIQVWDGQNLLDAWFRYM